MAPTYWIYRQIGLVSVTVPDVHHYHRLEGASAAYHRLEGPSAAYHDVEGPAAKYHKLEGPR